MVTENKVLIVASGKSATLVNDYDYAGDGWTIVVVNNAWQVIKDWDYWIHTGDYKGAKPDKLEKWQREISHPDYNKVLDLFGGIGACGFSITLAASYYALHILNPEVIGYLGADMNYTPDEKGHTHFYGVGYDIARKGISDPDLMVRMRSEGNPTYLYDIYMRFSDAAAERDCKLVNFSNEPDTRLPYPKGSPVTFS